MLYRIFFLNIILLLSCESKIKEAESSLPVISNTDSSNKKEMLFVDTSKECNAATYLKAKIFVVSYNEILNAKGYKELIVKYFGEQLGVNEEFSIKDINSIKKVEEVEVHSFGKAKIYSVKFSEELPEVALDEGLLVINEATLQVALLPIEDLKLIKLEENQKGFFIGGNCIPRTYGTFVVYDVENDSFKPIFDTGMECFCNYGIPVVNYSLDCYSYDKFKLSISNIDKNNDKVLDLYFIGKVLHFCRDGETNIGRNDRKPLKIIPIEITFYADINKNTWFFKDTTQCEKLNSYR